MKCTFYVQSNLNAVESAKIQKACEGWNIPVTLFKLKPFSNSVPRLGAQFPFILIGSTTLNRNCDKSRKYRHGVFFDADRFKPSAYCSNWQQDFLNYDMQVFQLKDVPKDLYPIDTEVFIRSNDDSKNISGGKCFFSELLDIQANTETIWIAGDIFTPESEICIAPLKNLYAEYRILFCEGEIIGSSKYKPSIHYSVPQDVLEYAKRMQEIWQPHDVFVMDICETDEGLKVIECNCLNGAGWYEADYTTVVDKLANYQIRKTYSGGEMVATQP